MLGNIQRGFTLIELIIVIVILGILSVTAAPRFIDIQSDALNAQMDSLQGSLKSANSLVYGKALISGQTALSPGSITIGTDSVSTTLGYLTPLGENVMKALDGSYQMMVNANDTITADWGIYNLPGGKSIYIVPKGYATFDSCNLLYNVDPTIVAEPVYYNITNSGC